MAWSAKGVDKTRCERLNQLIRETGITQYALAKQTGIAQQNLSSMMLGKVNLSEGSARKVIDVFPNFRIQWLLGFDNFKTETDLVAHYLKMQKKRNDKTKALFCILADLGKWEIDPSSVVGGAEYSSENEAVNGTNFFSWEFDNYARVTNGPKTLTLNKTEFESFVSKMADYFSFELLHMDASKSSAEQ